MERITNNAVTTLDGSINDSVTTLVVTDATVFPTSGNFTILVNDELMKVTGVSTDTFTVTRGQEGTPAASHTNGDDVTLIASAAAVNQLIDDRILIGPADDYADTDNQAKLYVCNDAPFTVVNRSSLLWTPYIPIQTFAISDYTVFNGTGLTATQTSDFAAKLNCVHTSGDALRGYVKAYSGPRKIDAWLAPLGPTNAWNVLGLCFRNNADDKTIAGSVFYRYTSNAHWLQFVGQYFTTLTSGSADVQRPLAPNLPVLIRAEDDSVNTVTFSVSQDGVNFTTVYTKNYAALFTPNRIGFFVNNNTSYTVNNWIANIWERAG